MLLLLLLLPPPPPPPLLTSIQYVVVPRLRNKLTTLIINKTGRESLIRLQTFT
jgi:hypothetical protein